jgi:hypothetical protein
MPPEPWPENDPSTADLEARLRKLPPPPVPPRLEARLLAAIPTPVPPRSRRWTVWVGVGAALAAACLLAVLVWPRHSIPDQTRPTARAPIAINSVPPERKARRDLDEMEVTTFEWPLAERPPLRLSSAMSPHPFD